MPKLRIMELWGTSSVGTAYLFRYKVTNGRATITWRSSQYRILELDDLAKSAWERTMKALGYEPFALKIEPFPESRQQIQESQGRFIYK